MPVTSKTSCIGLLKCMHRFAFVASKSGRTFFSWASPGISWRRVPELLSHNVKSRSGERCFWNYFRNNSSCPRNPLGFFNKTYIIPLQASIPECLNRKWRGLLAWLIPKSLYIARYIDVMKRKLPTNSFPCCCCCCGCCCGCCCCCCCCCCWSFLLT